MYVHELNYKHVLERHNELLKEAQAQRLIRQKNFKIQLANLLYKLADQLENPIQAEPALRNQ